MSNLIVRTVVEPLAFGPAAFDVLVAMSRMMDDHNIVRLSYDQFIPWCIQIEELEAAGALMSFDDGSDFDPYTQPFLFFVAPMLGDTLS